GGRVVKRSIDFYNLDAVIAVGYRVNSKKATKFRIWSTRILRQYLVKGFSLNEHRLSVSTDKFDELDRAIEFLKSSPGPEPLKAKVSVRMSKVVAR
ncbi:MAG: virulence RhuM family protein, partial [Patescibacteria group bacterium]|nr:virulence RhuM family protein [Patescibacteria group bacterium]